VTSIDLVDPLRPTCACRVLIENEKNGRGPLERAIGAGAIVQLAREQSAGRPDSRMGDVLDAAGVFAAAREGDPVALAVVEQVGSTFATLAPALLLLCPDAVVISGGVARAGDIRLEVVGRHLTELTLIPPRVELSTLAEDATLIGAFWMGLDRVWQRQLTTAVSRDHD
jgi:predicted NBD/HSP70 family sugar kinase